MRSVVGSSHRKEDSKGALKGAVGENYKLEGADTEFLLRTYGCFKPEVGSTSGSSRREKGSFSFIYFPNH